MLTLYKNGSKRGKWPAFNEIVAKVYQFFFGLFLFLAWLGLTLLYFFAVAVAGGATNVAKPKYQLGVAGAALAAGNLNLQHYKFR